MADRNYYGQAFDRKDDLVRDVSALLGWGDDPDAQAEACRGMGYDVGPDDESADIAMNALAELPLGVQQTTVYTIFFGVGGPTTYAEIDVRDNEVIGGRYVTTAPGYAESAPTQTVALTDEEADTLATAFLPDLT